MAASFQMLDRESGPELNNAIEVHSVELTKTNLRENTILQTSKLEQWAFLLLLAQDYDSYSLKRLLTGIEFETAIDTIEVISAKTEDKQMYVLSSVHRSSGYNCAGIVRIVGGDKMSKSIHGTVAGNWIRIEEPLGLPDGTGVEVVVRPIELSDQSKRLKLESLFGSCRNDAADLDAFLLANAAQRRLSRAVSGE